MHVRKHLATVAALFAAVWIGTAAASAGAAPAGPHLLYTGLGGGSGSTVGPDGALYVLDYGTGWGLNANTGLYRIEYSPGGRAPVAKAAADKTSGVRPLAVAFSSAGSFDPENGPLSYSWTFGDGGTSTTPNPTHTYATNGQYTATLTVTDNTARTANARVVVTVGNTAPTVNLIAPADGQPFSFGDTVPYQISVTDPEDGAVDCANVSLTYLLGHDHHAHQITTRTGCSGTITVPMDGEHDGGENVFGVFDAQYTDHGANGQPPLTTHTTHVLQPRQRQAEHFTAQQGILVEPRLSGHGAAVVAFIENGDWISFHPYVLSNATSLSARIASAGAGGTIQVRAGSPTGPLLGSAGVPVTGSWDSYFDVAATLAAAPAGTTDLFLVFTGGPGFLFNVDDVRLTTAPAPATEAETFSSQSGVAVVDTGTANGGHRVGFIENGDWVGYQALNVAGARSLSVRVSSGGAGGRIDVRAGSPTGPVLGSVPVPATGGWDNYTTVSGLLSGTASGPLFLVFAGGAGFLFDVDTVALPPRGPTGPIVGVGGRCVGTLGGGSANGTAIVLWDCNGNVDQQWTFAADGTVRSMGKCLDVANFGTANGSLTHLWDCANPPTGNQIWLAQLDGSLVNPVSGRNLDAVDFGRAGNGNRLHLWDRSNGANQRWQPPDPA